MFMIGGIIRWKWKRFLRIMLGLGRRRMFPLVADEPENNQPSERRRDQKQLQQSCHHASPPLYFDASQEPCDA